jgi:hypothetical protein
MQRRNFTVVLFTLTTLLLSTVDAAAQDSNRWRSMGIFMVVFGAGTICVLELFRRAFTVTEGLLAKTLAYTSGLLLAYELFIWTGSLIF